MSDKIYQVNEIFASLQGEGMRAGTFNIFVRFTGCNLQCAMEPGPLSPGGFDCDTEFAAGRKMTGAEIVDACFSEWDHHIPEGDKIEGMPGVIFTGGEPSLQLDSSLLTLLDDAGFGPLCIETNGSRDLKEIADALNWITVSPKVAEHAIKQTKAHEVKYVRGYGQAIPKTVVRADHYLISPAFDGMDLGKRNLDWCIQLVKENPEWRLSVQLHKAWGLR